ncbi:unnamed protein product [marine sediment metagenome]|uniref:Uncharacterized protein n=1 Tax=marine sediment metagenome TaxID=412755 RepID=X1TCR9_9ZZZZ
MAEPARSSTNPMALTPAVFNILIALVDGEKHGFAILLNVEKTTNGRVKNPPRKGKR